MGIKIFAFSICNEFKNIVTVCNVCFGLFIKLSLISICEIDGVLTENSIITNPYLFYDVN